MDQILQKQALSTFIKVRYNIHSIKNKQIYVSKSKHLAREVINTSRQEQSKTTQCLHGSQPPWGYIHQLFFFIVFSQLVTSTEPQNPTSPKTGYLRTFLDPPSLRYNTNHFTTYYNTLHIALQVSHRIHKTSTHHTCT
jgi:hypothetical protein